MNCIKVKIKLLVLSFLIVVTAIASGCQTLSFSQTKEKISARYSNFQTFLNGEIITLDTIYLDKDNIKSIKINKQEKTVRIEQKNRNTEFFSPQSSFQSGNFQGIIINGLPVENFGVNKIEIGSIKSMNILKEQSEIYNPISGNFLIITLK